MATVLAGLAVAPDATAHSSGAQTSSPVVVVLRDNVDSSAVAARHGRRVGVRVTRVFSKALNGYAATVTPRERAALQADEAVLFVADDVEVRVTTKAATQVLPTGVNRIEGERSSAGSGDGRGSVDADIAVIDGGFQLDHPDVDIRPGIDCVGLGYANGGNHGLAVGGVAAAADNGIGVVGVSPGARIWAIGTQNANGSGLVSNVICGLDWVVAHADTIEVTNMSLAALGTDDGKCGRVNGDAMHVAICRVVAAGVTVVASAGNDGSDAATRVPAAYSEVITVSGVADFDGIPGGLGSDCLKNAAVLVHDDTFAYFSNYGAVVDIAAPALCLLSTDLKSKYSLHDGTSFASPHVAGAAALYLAAHPNATPAQVRRALVDAGRFDYDSTLDPDRIKEPLLDVSTF